MVGLPLFAALDKTLGDVAMRFNVLACMGESGADKDLLSVLCPPVLVGSSLDLGFGDVAAGFAFVASVSDLIVTLTTWVASAVRSLELNASSADDVAALALGFAGVLAGRVVDLAFVAAVSVASGVRSFLRATTVVGVHVEGEDTAALTVSTCSCNEGEAM